MVTVRSATALTLPTFLLTACGTARVTTPHVVPPSATVQAWNEFAAPRKTLAPSTSEAAARWMLPASSPWAAYDKMTLLAALGSVDRTIELPNVEELDAVLDAKRAAEIVAHMGLPGDLMWITDLRGAASVAFGATLSQAAGRAVAPVMTFNNWPAQDELVPAEETLAALVTMQPKLAPPGDPGVPLFMLDAWRLAYRHQVPDDETTDNRYMLTASDLPDAAVLKSQGIRHVMYVVENLAVTTVEEDDLHAVFTAYQDAGITISMVDLRWLFALDGPSRWDERLYERRLYVEPRVTILEDEWFYRRAHGGFGGVHVYMGGGGHGFGHGMGMGMGGHGGHGGG
jgi:hypothetical protein